MQFVRNGKNLTIIFGGAPKFWTKFKSIEWQNVKQAYFEKVPEMAAAAGFAIGGCGGLLVAPLYIAETFPQAVILTPIMAAMGALGGTFGFYAAAHVAPPLIPLCGTGAGLFYLKKKFQQPTPP